MKFKFKIGDITFTLKPRIEYELGQWSVTDKKNIGKGAASNLDGAINKWASSVVEHIEEWHDKESWFHYYNVKYHHTI